MCGIAGFISASASGDPKAILRRMTTTIQHRGPRRCRLVASIPVTASVSAIGD